MPWENPANVRVCWVGDRHGKQGWLVEQAMTSLFADYPEFSIHFTGGGSCTDGEPADLRIQFEKVTALTPDGGAAAHAPPDVLVFPWRAGDRELQAAALGLIAARSGAGSREVVLQGAGIRLPRKSVVRLRELYTTPLGAVAFVTERQRFQGRGAWLGVGELPAGDLQALVGNTLGSVFVAGAASVSVSGSIGPDAEAGTSVWPGGFVSLDPVYGEPSASVYPLARAVGSTTKLLGPGDYVAGDLRDFAGGHIPELDVPAGLAAFLCLLRPNVCLELRSGAPVNLAPPGARLHLEPAVTAFSGERFAGPSVALVPGRYYHSDSFASIGGTVGSLVVPPGLEVIACMTDTSNPFDWADADALCVHVGPEAGGAVSLASLLQGPGVALRVETARGPFKPTGQFLRCLPPYVVAGSTGASFAGVAGTWSASPYGDGTYSYAWTSPTNDPPDLQALVASTSRPTACAPDANGNIAVQPPREGPGAGGCQSCGRYLPDDLGTTVDPLASAP